jgi:acyl transferase domain-containing protein
LSSEAFSRKAILGKIRTGELSAEEAMELLVRAAGPPETAEPDGRLRERLEARLAEIIAAEARIPRSRVAPQEPFERYGFDSVMALNVTRVLQEDFGQLSPTLLFEHQTVASLAGYLAEHHRERAVRATGETTAAPAAAAARPSPARPERPAPLRRPVPESAVRPAEGGIAIIGLSCRFPLAGDLETFWDNLKAGRDCIQEIPEERWDLRRYFDPEKGRPGRSYSKWGGFLADFDKFDASFFHISPREAERMDPQERLFLEEVWHALEDAALTRERLAGRTVGVYVGVMYSQYQLLQAEEALKGNFLYLGSSYASIANRVSYTFDFSGPSMALDTMCSSSSTAIHLACEALRSGDIHVAVAGGVNLTIHPNKHVDLSQGRYAASDGRCRSFGAGGDGYVPGEGVGAAILKPLAAAIADGDRILAVLRGSSLNHGGKTNGYSVPNPKAQSRLIAEAFARAGVSPRQVGYIEAHGTGTSLGDPIEIAGLVSAFREETADTGFCAVGSVKSNIGHLESAAGIAGLAKVVLQMRHRQLVPSLHAETLNPHIDFAGTPFYVQRGLEDWPQPAVPDGGAWRSVPRVAGISSFGAGGANAHLVVEEWVEPEASAPAAAGAGHLILLSAQSGERLAAAAGALAGHLAGARFDGVPEAEFLASAAFTLQTGREALEERLALWVTGREELVRKLRAFAGRGEADGVLRGRVDEERADFDVLLGGEAGVSFLASLIASRDLERLARLWLRGTRIDWERLAPEPRPRKIALPGYPFARERHWAPLSSAAPAAVPGRLRPLHPLVGRNVSTLWEQRFTTSLDGSEPFVRDHAVAGQLLLPGAALLEMVRAAGALSGLGELARIEGTMWEKPVVVSPGQGCELSISLVPSGPSVEYTVWTEPAPETREIHARGRLVQTGEPEPAAPERIDPQSLGEGVRSLDVERCYRTFEELGLAYGPGFRTLERLQSAGPRALGRLRLPAVPGDERDGFVLHPALLDGALQTVIACQGDLPPVAQVPFSLERLEILGPLPDTCLVLAAARQAGADEQGRPRIFDITMADEGGLVVARLRGLAVRPVLRAAGTARGRTLVLHPVWRTAGSRRTAAAPPRTLLVFESSGQSGDLFERAGSRVVRVRPGTGFAERGGDLYEVAPGNADHYRQLLARIWTPQGGPDAIVHAWSGAAAPAAGSPLTPEMLEEGFFSLLALTQALMQQKPSGGRLRLVYVHPAGEGGPQAPFAAIGAFNRTVARENPSLVLTTLELGAGADGACAWDETAAARVLSEIAGESRGGEEVRYEGNDRLVRALEVVPGAETGGAAPLKPGGVYLLTGGLGGLGRIFAEHLAERFQARLVLSGRSPLGADGAAFLDRLGERGGRAVYVQADCARREDALRLAGEAKRAFGHIDGVLHLAGTLRDGFLLRKRREDAEAVLAPKVWGTVHLDEATRDEPLDFFALFSSATAWLGTVGQGDYGFANALMDRLAARREAARRAGTRSGRSVSIGWPLWQGGGMDVDAAARVRIEQTLGWLPLPPDEGTRVFAAALAAADTERTVFHGDPAKILETLGLAGEARPAAAAGATRPAVEVREGAAPEEALLAALRKLVAAELKMPVDRLDPRTPFEHLGIESVMVMNMTRELEKDFGELPKTLFFEHRNLHELARHLLAHHADRVAARFQAAAPARVEIRAAAPASGAYRLAAATPSGEAIAIIGVSGRYPMADTLDELWTSLAEGRDCITEVPADRWDHRRYFDPAKNRPGKSYSKWGGFLRDFDRFDPLFFNISPREARLMDPQERLFLQTAWHTLEDAGTTRRALAASRVGVFVGVMYAQYQLYGAHGPLQERGFVPSSLSSSVANRVSYVLDFRGPSLAVDTMCSSSLTALHLACASLRDGDCEVALAGGVNLTLHPNKYLQLSQGKFASTDGRCRSFGEGGDGYVPGEGVGAVLLKPLSRALADGDQIYAVVRGSAINHGGRSNGYSVPTPVAQAEVIRRAIERSGVDPRDIGYVEAHGTGTSLGDPIEIAGLARALAAAGAPLPKQSCPIGSVKSNLGHLESAAGIAGVTKVLLQMRHGLLAPSLHAERLSSNINFEESPFFVQRGLEPWRARSAGGAVRPRIAAVSSFGAGGSNAHVILEEHVAPARAAEAPSPQLIVLSARTEEQLRASAGALAGRLDPRGGEPARRDPEGAARLLAGLAATAAEIFGVAAQEIEPDEELESLGFEPVSLSRLAERIRRDHGVELTPGALAEHRTLRGVAELVAVQAPGVPAAGAPGACRLDDTAYTLQVGREALEERLAVLASDAGELARELRRFAAGETPEGFHRGRAVGETDTLRDGDPKAPEELARLWISGVDVDWSALHYSGARRVSLPTYPFARDRYWIPEDEGAAEALEAPVEARPSAPVPVPEPALPAVDTGEAWERARAIIVEAMAAVLEIGQTEFELDLPHSDFGVDSVLAVEIVDRINLSLGTELKPTDFFNYSTLRKLADYVARESAPRQRPAAAPALAPAVTAARPAASAAPAGNGHNGNGHNGSGGNGHSEPDRLTELLQRLERGEISAHQADRLLANLMQVEGQ